MSKRDEALRLAQRIVDRETFGMTFKATTEIARALLDCAAENERLTKDRDNAKLCIPQLDAHIVRIEAERDQLRAEVERMRAVYEAAVAVIANQKLADDAHLHQHWLRDALDLSKALEDAVDAATKATP